MTAGGTVTSIKHLQTSGQRLWRAKDKNIPSDAVDIGSGSPWATPFRPGKDGTRQEVVAQFEKWLAHAPDRRARWMRGHIIDLVGRDLVCNCSLESCHGDILLNLAALETHRPELQGPPAGIWLRLSVVENEAHSHYLIQVSDPGPTGTVLDAVGH